MQGLEIGKRALDGCLQARKHRTGRYNAWIKWNDTCLAECCENILGGESLGVCDVIHREKVGLVDLPAWLLELVSFGCPTVFQRAENSNIKTLQDVCSMGRVT